MIEVILHLLYGLLLGAGGYMGYAKKGSLASFIGGASIGIFYLIASYLLYSGSVSVGRNVSLVTSIVLLVLGIVRFVTVQKKTLPIVFISMGVIMLLLQAYVRTRQGVKTK
ncbi:hypothetical protein ABK040_013501 [Willaertia magna]